MFSRAATATKNVLLPSFKSSRYIATLNDSNYHKYADEYLENLVDYLEDLGDSTDLSGYDVLYSSGVLTLTLGEFGSYVVNKQPPNKQIWLSSPTSGPKRFDYDADVEKWVSLRDGQCIKELLDSELSAIMKTPMETP